MYLLETKVISELRRPKRNRGVAEWIAEAPVDALYLSVITIGEIARGIAKQRRTGPARMTSQADALQAWLEGLLADYSKRILLVDVAIATRWGRLCDAHPQFPTDMLIAATALDHGLTVVTRNVAHFPRRARTDPEPVLGAVDPPPGRQTGV